jgi:transitional endoplasmic reticulum ATPase
METHPLPIVCTSSVLDRLDEAALRRFTLKLRFGHLTASQATLAFHRFSGVDAPR